MWSLLSLMNTLLDISKIMHFNLISTFQISRLAMPCRITCKIITRMGLLNIYLTILLKIMCEFFLGGRNILILPPLIYHFLVELCKQLCKQHYYYAITIHFMNDYYRSMIWRCRGYNFFYRTLWYICISSINK